MRQNNKGFSLVELIVALAIFAIAGVAVFGFTVNSSRLYQRSNVDVKLQYEQQLAVNQIRDMVVESDRGIYYDETDKTLALYGALKNEGGTEVYPVTVIHYEQVQQKLYFGTKDYSAVTEITFDDLTLDDMKLLAENVTDFKVDLTKVKNDKVLFEVTFMVGDKLQTVKETVALRNRLVVSNQVNTIWDEDAVVVDSFIKAITISRGSKEFTTGEQDEIGKHGSSVVVAYAAKVIANEESDRDYTVSWRVDNLEGVSVSTDGEVTVASSVQSGKTFHLYATSVDDPTKSTYIEIKVTDNGVYPVEVTLDCPNQNITEGNGFRTYKLVPTVKYSNDKASSDYDLFTWDGVDSLPDGATFKKEMGELTLGPNANGSSITIKAKAKERKADGTVAWGEYTIVVEGIEEFKPGPTVKISCGTTLERGGYVFPTMVFENATHSDYTYNWKIEPYYDEETTQFDSEVANSAFKNISLNTTSGYSQWNVNQTLVSDKANRVIALNCAQNLNWDKTFKVKVSGTATDAEGNVLTATPRIVTVKPVELEITCVDIAEWDFVYNGYPCVTDTEICYEDWNFDGRQPGNIYASQYDMRRYFYIDYINLYMKENWLNGCNLYYNFEFKDSAGLGLDKYAVGLPSVGTYNGSMRFCQFMKQRFNDWEISPVRPAEMLFSVTVKDGSGNVAESNKQNFKLVYEWRKIDVSEEN